MNREAQLDRAAKYGISREEAAELLAHIDATETPEAVAKRERAKGLMDLTNGNWAHAMKLAELSDEELGQMVWRSLGNRSNSYR
jgi:DNA-directed RNA polymerase subunit F